MVVRSMRTELRLNLAEGRWFVQVAILASIAALNAVKFTYRRRCELLHHYTCSLHIATNANTHFFRTNASSTHSPIHVDACAMVDSLIPTAIAYLLSYRCLCGHLSSKDTKSLWQRQDQRDYRRGKIGPWGMSS